MHSGPQSLLQCDNEGVELLQRMDVPMVSLCSALKTWNCDKTNYLACYDRGKKLAFDPMTVRGHVKD